MLRLLRRAHPSTTILCLGLLPQYWTKQPSAGTWPNDFSPIRSNVNQRLHNFAQEHIKLEAMDCLPAFLQEPGNKVGALKRQKEAVDVSACRNRCGQGEPIEAAEGVVGNSASLHCCRTPAARGGLWGGGTGHPSTRLHFSCSGQGAITRPQQVACLLCQGLQEVC